MPVLVRILGLVLTLIASEALPQTDETCRVTPTIAEDYLRSSRHMNVTVKYSLAWQAVFLGYV